MARGWESKSVEEQQSQATEQTSTPDAAQRAAKAEQLRKIQALRLNRARIREQLDRSSSERYKEMLQRELEHIDSQLSGLEN